MGLIAGPGRCLQLGSSTGTRSAIACPRSPLRPWPRNLNPQPSALAAAPRTRRPVPRPPRTLTLSPPPPVLTTHDRTRPPTVSASPQRETPTTQLLARKVARPADIKRLTRRALPSALNPAALPAGLGSRTCRLDPYLMNPSGLFCLGWAQGSPTRLFIAAHASPLRRHGLFK